MNLNKRARLFDVNVKEITLCKNPSVPGADILILKSKDKEKPNWTQKVTFKAFDDEKQIAYGYAMVPDVTDFDDEYVNKADIEAAAHSFLANLAKGQQKGEGTGLEHEVFEDVGHPVESMIDRGGMVGKSLGFPKDKIKPDGWIIGIKMSDKHWEMTKSGEITGFSIGGNAKRIDEGAPLEATHKKTWISRLSDWALRKKAEGTVQKVAYFDDIVESREVIDELMEKTFVLMDSFWSIMDDPDVTNKVAAVQKTVSQYLDFVGELNKTEKSFIEAQKKLKGEPEMNEELVTKMTTVMEDLSKSIGTLNQKLVVEPVKKTDDEEKPPKPGVDAETVEEKLTKSLTELTTKVESLQKQVDGAPEARAGDDVDESDTTTKKATSGEVSITDLTKNTPLSFRIDARK